MNPSFEFASVAHFTAGTVGPKGQRAFYLQFGNPGELATLKVEKGQVAAMAEYFDQLLDDLDPVAPGDVPLALDLVEPIEAAWVVDSIGVALPEEGGIVVVAEERLPADHEDAEPATATLHVEPGQIRAFIDRARDLVSAGRPPCTYCGTPLDHDDGWCPCWN